MKLVKIENIRESQIYKDKNNLYLIIDIICGNTTYQKYNTYDLKGILKEKGTDCDFLFFKDKERKLIGFLGITHEIKDNKLIEIPREEFEEDDIILQTNFYKNEYGDIVGQFTKKICYNGYIDDLEKLREKNDKIEKIGILGVNYFFQNSKLNN